MPTARQHKQRKVTRGRWRNRFKSQRQNWRNQSKFGLPTITSISPNTAVHGTGADFTLTVTGTGFVAGVTYIVWNGGDERTVVTSPTTCTTTVKPSLVGQAIVVPVKVRNGPLLSTGTQNFTFT